MSEEINKIIRLSFQNNNASKIKSLEARMIGPSKNGLPPIITKGEEINSDFLETISKLITIFNII